MSFYWVKTHQIIKRLFSNYIWDIPNKENKIYITFDDGPTPEITPWVLKTLKQFNAKATFFCIGKNINANLDIFYNILKENHSVGNHTQSHLNGWKTSTKDYVSNVLLTQNTIEIITNKKCSFFRPPYGKITRNQHKTLKKNGIQTVLWDVLSADFDVSISSEKCIENVVKNTQSGSILVFHDSLKASTHLKIALPEILKILQKKGFVFEKL